MLFSGCEPVPPDAEVTLTPVFDIADGTFNKDIEVAISCPSEGAVIYYTLDSAVPDISALIYTGPISVTGDGSSLILKAAAKGTDMRLSEIASASYSISYFDLIVQAGPNGFVSPSGTLKAAEDSSTIISATAESGWGFSHWSVEDGAGVVIDDVYSSSTNVVLTEAGGSVQANFSSLFSLTVSSDDNGTTIPGGEIQIIENIPQTITAISDTGCRFDNWSIETGSGISFEDADSSDTTVTLSDGDAEIKANFEVWPEIDKLLAEDAAAEDLFGCSVSISGDYAVIGAYGDNENGSSTGAAYVFNYDGTSWQQQVKLTAEDGSAYSLFGYSVSISDDYIVIGSRGLNNGSYPGSAYIFHQDGSTWEQQAKIIAEDLDVDDFFGYSVSISGDYAVVGSPYDDDDGNSSGSAYVFHRNEAEWTQQSKIKASDGAEGDQFGSSVSISGDYAIIGSSLNDDDGDASGSAYIYTRSGSTWSQQTKLTASGGDTEEYFGCSVSIDDDYVVVGAYYDDNVATHAGAAYIFNRVGAVWNQQAKITAADGTLADSFGKSVSISGNYAVIGTGYDSDSGSLAGSAYIFNRNGTIWTQLNKLVPSDIAAEDYFGLSVSLSGGKTIAGSYNDDDNGDSSGSAFIFGGE